MRKPSKRTLSVLAVVLLLVWGGFLLTIGWAMRQPPEKVWPGDVARARCRPSCCSRSKPCGTRREQAQLQPGEMAPDFRLPTLDHKSEVQLAALRGKPVVLVFGSYT